MTAPAPRWKMSKLHGAVDDRPRSLETRDCRRSQTECFAQDIAVHNCTERFCTDQSIRPC